MVVRAFALLLVTVLILALPRRVQVLLRVLG